MSYIVLQFGQCGNQLGNAFFSSLYNDLFSKECGLSNSDNLKYIDTSLIRWFNKTSNNILTARSILFDTEEKVISHLKCTELGTNTWSFSSENVIINNKGGCGNNWAAGYNESGPESSAKILEQIRKESEKCDNVRCFLTLGSAGGGTGSGVSSYVNEIIRNEYSHKAIIASFVLPYADGDVVTQNYNTILTLSKCYSLCDAIVLINNQDIHKQLNYHFKNYDYLDINNCVSEYLSCFLQPFSNSSFIQDILIPLVPHPKYKLLTLMANSFGSESVVKFKVNYKWETLIRNLNFRLIQPNFMNIQSSHLPGYFKLPKSQQQHKFIGNLLICRGKGSNIPEATLNKHYGNSSLYPLWVSKSDRIAHLYHNRKFCKNDGYALLASNSKLICNSLDNIIDQGWCSYIHNAYIHHYKKYNLEQEDMIDAFAKVEDILNNYNSF